MRIASNLHHVHNHIRFVGQETVVHNFQPNDLCKVSKSMLVILLRSSENITPKCKKVSSKLVLLVVKFGGYRTNLAFDRERFVTRPVDELTLAGDANRRISAPTPTMKTSEVCAIPKTVRSTIMTMQ